MQTRHLRTRALPVALVATLGFVGCEQNTLVVSDDVPPAVPTGVYTVTGDTEVEVRWNPVRMEDVAGYGIYRSPTLDGAYTRIAEVSGIESDAFVDVGLENGTTYYYAVDAYDYAGNESELSYEDAFDTPRPQGADVTVYAQQFLPDQSGIDFSAHRTAGFVKAHNHVDTDIAFQRVNGLVYAVGTLHGQFWNDIQDLGFTESLDEVSWAPGQGWSVSPNGVEMIAGHTYVVWTHDSHFAKFRVVEIFGPQGSPPSGVRIDWAYQVDQGNQELRIVRPGDGERDREREVI